jgi:hypothetical protein
MSSAIGDLVGKVVVSIRHILPDGVDCRPLHCQLDLAEITREFHRAPGALVAVPQISCDEVQGGEPIATVSMAVFLLVEGVRHADRGSMGLELVERLLRRITRERWDADGVRRAQGVTARVVYMDELERKAVTIWEVSWTQALELPDATEGLLTDYAGATLTVLPNTEPTDG